MTDALTRIAAEALALSSEERAQLVDCLLESLPDDENAPVSDAWMAEIERRCQEREDGMETYPAEEVFAKLRREYA